MDKTSRFFLWLEEEGKDEKTVVAYRSILNQFQEWLHGSDIKITDAKPIIIKEYQSYMRHNLNRSQATINKATAGLKTFYAWLADRGDINDNPMTRIKIQKVQSSDKINKNNAMKWLTREEQERFISYVELERNEFKRLRNLAIIDVMLYAGLRVAEVEALKLNDIKINGDVTLTIREGKRGKYATVTLIDKYSKNLRKWFKYRQSLAEGKYIQSPCIFVSERTGQLGSRGIQVMLTKYARLASMENITPHRFRHSFCKNLANAGVSLEVICKLARHESIETTKIYVDPSHAEMVQALRNM